MKMTVEEAKAALDKAEAAWMRELELDCNRRDGSGAQEARRERHREELQEEKYRCKKALEEALREEAESDRNPSDD